MLVHIIGTRPQYIKAAVVVSALRKAGLEILVIDTGQHYDPEMSVEIWKNFEMEAPEILISNNENDKSNPQLIANQIKDKISDIFVSAIVVYGDTNSALAGAIVAGDLQIPLVHIEAGLRSFNNEMPEERNRIRIDKLSSVLFCSSETGIKNLNNEGIKGEIILSGDVMYNAFLFAQNKIPEINLEKLHSITNKPFAVLTIHRPQNTENLTRLNNILEAMEDLPFPVLWPVHPRIKKAGDFSQGKKNIHPVAPQNYFTMQALINKSEIVCTDSGGLQKEAYWAMKPCITLRNDTEWVETLHNNWNVLTGDDKEKIISALGNYPQKETWKPLYTGNPVGIITDYIQKFETEGYPSIK